MEITLNFLPAFKWKMINNYPIYQMPIYYIENNKKITMYWGINWFYFKQLWSNIPAGNLSRYVWFKHLYINLKCFIFLPYIIFNNLQNDKKTGFIKYKEY